MIHRNNLHSFFFHTRFTSGRDRWVSSNGGIQSISRFLATYDMSPLSTPIW